SDSDISSISSNSSSSSRSGSGSNKTKFKTNKINKESTLNQKPDLQLSNQCVTSEFASPMNKYCPTINIAIVGAVSAGKSTLNNALFVEQYSDASIKRTTTMPQVYVETPKSQYTVEEAQSIREHNRKINNHYMDSTANGQKMTLDDIGEIYYAVPK